MFSRQDFSRTSSLVALFVMAAATSLLLSSQNLIQTASAADQTEDGTASGDTVEITGKMQFVDKNGDVIDANTTGPAPNNFPIGQKLQDAGMVDATGGRDRLVAAQGGTDFFPSTSSKGTIAPTTNPYETTYTVPVQRSQDGTLDYRVYGRVLMQDKNEWNWNVYTFQQKREDGTDNRIQVPPGTYSVIGPGGDIRDDGKHENFTETPAMIKVCFHHKSHSEEVLYDSGDNCPAGDATVNAYNGRLSAKATGTRSHGKIEVGSDDDPKSEYVVVRGGFPHVLSSGSQIEFDDPITGERVEVPFQSVTDKRHIGLDFDQDGTYEKNNGDDVVPKLDVRSVSIPLRGKVTSCGFANFDIIGETEAKARLRLSGGTPRGWRYNRENAKARATFDSDQKLVEGIPTELSWGSIPEGGLFPKTYKNLGGEAEVVGTPQPGWNPRSGTTLLNIPAVHGWRVDSDNNIIKDFKAEPGKTPGTLTRSDCLDMTTSDYEPFVTEPVYASGAVTLYDRGTEISATSADDATFLDSVLYRAENLVRRQSSREYRPLTRVIARGAKTQSGVDVPQKSAKGATGQTEPVPPKAENADEPKIDRTLNRSRGEYRMPLVTPEKPGGPYATHWRVEQFMYRAHHGDSSTPNSRINHRARITQRRENPDPNKCNRVKPAPEGPVTPGEEIKDQNFEKCFGLIRVKIHETGTNSDGSPKKLFKPRVDGRGMAFEYGDSDPIPNPDDPRGENASCSEMSDSQRSGDRVDIFGPRGGQMGSPASQSNASTVGTVNLMLPEGLYNLNEIKYNLESGGSTQIPGIQDIAIDCGEIKVVDPSLRIDMSAPACVESGNATVQGTVDATPLSDKQEDIDNATITDVSYTVYQNGQQVAGPNSIQPDSGSSWDQGGDFSIDYTPNQACASYKVEVNAETKGDVTASSSKTFTVSDGSEPNLQFTDTSGTKTNISSNSTILLEADDTGTAKQTLAQAVSATSTCGQKPLGISFSSNESSFSANENLREGSYTVTATTDADDCGNQASVTFTAIVGTIEASVDIQPGVNPSTLDICQSPTEVAIGLSERASDAGYGVEDIAVSSLDLAGIPPASDGSAGYQYSVEDRDEDGQSRLFVHFDTSQFDCSTATYRLSGRFEDGTPLEGTQNESDPVSQYGCNGCEPTPGDDSLEIDEDQTVSGVDLLGNDSDPNGKELTISGVEQPENGTVTVSSDGKSVTVEPDTNYYGPISFKYTVTNGDLSATATVSIDVRPVNDAPEGATDSFKFDEDTTLSVEAPGVLANDSDVEGDTLRVVSKDSPANDGQGSFGTDGSFEYTPNTNYNGTDSVSYVVSDGNGGTDTVTVDLTIRPVNDAPEATDDSGEVDEDNSLTIDVLTNDSDVDEGDSISVTDVSGASNGEVTINGDGTVTYTPATNYYGSDSFTYTVSDSKDATDTASVPITIHPVNDIPVAAFTHSPAIPDEKGTLTLDGSGSSDVEGPIAEYTWTVTAPDGSTQTLSGVNPSISPQMSGDYTVELVVTDEQGADSPAVTQTIYVNALPSAKFSYSPDMPMINDTTVQLDGTASNDPDGQIAEYEWTVTAPDGTDVSLSSAGTATPSFIPSQGGKYTISLTVTDDNGATDTAGEASFYVAPADAKAISFAAFCTTEDSYSAGDVTITDVADNDESEPIAFTWDSATEISTVVIKAGPGMYNYDGGTSGQAASEAGTTAGSDQSPPSPCPTGEELVVKNENVGGSGSDSGDSDGSDSDDKDSSDKVKDKGSGKNDHKGNGKGNGKGH